MPWGVIASEIETLIPELTKAVEKCREAQVAKASAENAVLNLPVIDLRLLLGGFGFYFENPDGSVTRGDLDSGYSTDYDVTDTS